MTTSIEPASLRLTANDGYILGATRFSPPGPVRARLLVAGATAVPQGFYRRFAEYAAAQGYEVWTLDYRGIGRSAPATLRGFRMDYLDWAQRDLAALIEAADQPGQPGQTALPLLMIGHSFGGHAFGLLPNHHRIAAFWTFATGAGWHGWMPVAERWRVLALWHLVGPVVTRVAGYLPWRRLGLGEDLPLDVYRQWKHWCRYPRYFFEDPALPDLATRFAAVRTPIVAANALDDAWAPPASRDAFMAGYREAPVQMRDLDPKTHGPIGHMGYFRPRAEPLWREALDWFAGQTAN